MNQSDSPLYSQIATDLSDVEQVLKAMASQKTQSDTRQAQTFVAPRTPLEENLVEVWVNSLGVEKIGIHDNFFEMGGNSLLATQVTSQIRKVVQIDIPLRSIFEAPTIAQLAEHLQAIQQTEHTQQVNKIQPRSGDDGHLPLSFSQQRLWFLDQLEKGNVTYNNPLAIRLNGRVNLPALEKSLNEILDRHEVLRTTFATNNGQPYQIINKHQPLSLPVTELTTLPKQAQETETRRLIDKEAMAPFNLNQDIPFRAQLLKLGEEEHILMMTTHHIASDGWSFTILGQELTALYAAFSQNTPSPLSPLPIQYADFAVWQKTWLQGDDQAKQLTYWKQQLGGQLPVLELPTDYVRPAIQSFKEAGATHLLSTHVSQALNQLCQQEGATLFMTLLSAFKLLLYRYSGQEDIIIGSPIAGRNHAELENLLGFFINSLVLRTDLSGTPTFRQLIGRVREVCLNAYANQDIPFEKLLEELQPKRDLSRTPLFQIFFNMLNFNINAVDLPNLRGEVLARPEVGSKFDFTLYIEELGEQLRLRMVYNADLFKPERMAEMLVQFETLLTQIAANPDEKITHYTLVTDNAKAVLPDPAKKLNSDWHGAVHTAFSHQTTRVPQKVAVMDGHGRWTYKELEALSNQLANYLRAEGIQSQDVVAVVGQRKASLVCALLGILKAGAAFVILDPSHPVQRIKSALDVVMPRGWIHLESTEDPIIDLEQFADNILPACRLHLPHTPTEIRHLLKEQPTDLPEITTDPDDLAYVAFTSGSTGQPKGILGTHRPLSHFLHWHTQTFGLAPEERFSMLSGLSHDPLLRDIFTPLWLGATLCIPEQDYVPSPEQLINWMRQQKISVCHLTPAMGQLLCEITHTITTDNNNPTTAPTLPNLRYAFFGGDTLTRQDTLKMTQVAPSVTCINFYGTTETPQAMSYAYPSIDNATANDKENIPLGKGIQDVQLLVLNGAGQLAGVGETGEIYIRTHYLTKGYLQDNALTQKRYITNPFTNAQSDRLYKTNDLGRYLPKGDIEFLGRNDYQVKIRGFRIELEEIEAVLRQHPAVNKVAATVYQDDTSEFPRLVAYVVPAPQQPTPAISSLRDFMQEKLPAYMIPAQFVLLNSLPLTPNGKVDRKALPAPDQNRVHLDHAITTPKNLVEIQLVKIWEEILGIHPVGTTDNFFELGGHSLLAVHLFTKIEQTFGTNLPLATLFQNATIEHLAGLISRQTGLQTWSSLVEIQTQGNNAPFFCIHGITGDILWFRTLGQKLAPDHPFYGLQARGLDGVQESFTQVKEMAAHYIKEIRLLQPHGPYYLGGASFGGTVAFEMAQQLIQQKEQVALLAIFDHAPPGLIYDTNRNAVILGLDYAGKIVANFPYWLTNFLELGPKRILARIGRKARTTKKIFNTSDVELGRVDAADFIDYASELPDHRRKLIEDHIKAIKNYAPKNYPGTVTIFRAKSRPLFRPFDPSKGWEKLAPERTIIKDIPGSHEGIFQEPYVQYLAQQLKDSLDNPTYNER